MNDGVTAAVAVTAVLLWHNPQLYVLASCQGLGQGLSIKCIGCGTCTLKGSKFWTCQSHSHYDLNASLSLQLKQLKIRSMKEEEKKRQQTQLSNQPKIKLQNPQASAFK